MSPKKSPLRQKEEKEHNIAVQEKINADGQKKFEEKKNAEMEKVKEKVARGIFSGGLTFKQQLDLPVRVFGGGWPEFSNGKRSVRKYNSSRA